MRRTTFQPVRLAAALAVLVGGVLGTASAATAAAPSNDKFGNATVLDGPFIFNEFASTAGATAQAGEPEHAGQTPAASVWYRWTAPADVKVVSHSSLTLEDSLDQPEHALAFYTGSKLAALTPVGSDFRSETTVSFTAKAGTVYDIAINVAKKYAATGSTHLFLDAVPVNDDLADARKVSGTSGSVSGYIEGASLEIGDEPQHSLQDRVSGGSVWFDWTAPTSGFSRFGIECCASIGTQPVMAVYTGTSMENLTAVSSSYSCTFGAFNTCTAFQHVKGTTYHVVVQGDGTSFPFKWAPVASGCTVTGTAGADTLTGTSGSDLICGLGGNDTIKGLGGDDTIIGGPGVDTVDYSAAASSVRADLSVAASEGDNGTDTLQDVENITGSRFADTLTGNRGDNVIRGGAGRDSVIGGDGNDRLAGDAGKDVLAPGGGVDTVDGGTDTDEVSYDLAPAVTVDLTAGTANGEGTDTLLGLENVVGSDANDVIIGNALVNELVGGLGNDRLKGLGGNDKLYGWLGVDTMDGGAGADYCDGGGDGPDTPVSCDTFVP